MRTLTLAILAVAGSVAASLPAAAVPAGPLAGISPTSDMVTVVRMKRRHMRRSAMSRSQMMKPGASGVNNKTPGAAAGSNMGNGATGSYAAPSGK